MGAPDKIYTDNRGVYAELPIFSQIDANVEYIRKDALLEWAEKCKKIIEGSLRVKYDESLAIRGLMYAVFMDKLNEM